ncbi:hypothetical protein ACGCUP_01020 [Eubacteriales bacterium KG125]
MHEIEFIEDGHIYLVDGVITPSITQLLKSKFGNKYNAVSERVLSEASRKGVAVHKAIEEFEKNGTETDLEELRNYKLLKKLYGFEVEDNELMVVLEQDGEVKSVGTLDILATKDGKLGIGDIKRTATLDKEYVAHQLNLYRIAYQGTFNRDIDFLFALHLREDKKRYVEIPIREEMALDFLTEALDEINNADRE